MWISLIDFAQSLDKEPDKHKAPIKGQTRFTAPSPLFESIQSHINSEANLVSELPSFILSPTNKAHGEPVKLSSVHDQNSAVPLGSSTLQGFFCEAMPREDLSTRAN